MIIFIGRSIDEFCSNEDVSRTTFYRWVRPEAQLPGVGRTEARVRVYDQR